MKRSFTIIVLVVVAIGVFRFAGCGRGKTAEARAMCERLVELCGPEMADEGLHLSTSDVDECASDFASDGPRELGSAYEPFVACVTEADRCGEVIGCAAGAFGDDRMRDFGEGVSKKR